MKTYRATIRPRPGRPQSASGVRVQSMELTFLVPDDTDDHPDEIADGILFAAGLRGAFGSPVVEEMGEDGRPVPPQQPGVKTR